tara:strand:- start:847 stop:2367 length:1521 start_codon:yes stop_codon:yes gene_type:complete
MNKTLSKTSYLQGLKCSKFMWLNKHMKTVMDPISTGDIARIETGKDIGKLARQLFQNGVLVPDSIFDVEERVTYTSDLINSGIETIFEATFSFNNVQVRIDILNKVADGYEIYEVKSKKWTKKLNTSQKAIKELIDDISIQYYVLNGLSINVTETFLTCLDGEYVRDESIKVNKIFKNISTTEEVIKLQDSIPKNIELFINTLDSGENPDFKICSGCSKCSYKKYCWQDMPEFPVFSLLTISKKAFELYDKDIKAVEDIPDDYEFTSEAKKFIRDHWKNKTELFINSDKVNEALAKLRYPLFHLDFETFQSQVPLYKDTSPGQIIPFQYSLHIEEKNNTLIHKEYLAEKPSIDPREDLICNLIKHMQGDSSVVVYSNYEANTLQRLADEFPQYANELISIKNRIWDLAEIFQKRHIYFYQLKTKYSLKDVMPILVPKMSTKYLDLKESGSVSFGEEASNAFIQLMTERDKTVVDSIREGLLEYCKLDTESMVESLRAVIELNSSKG